MLLLALVICFYYRDGLVSKPIGQTGEFAIKHEQAGYAVSLYYPKIDPTKAHQKDVRVGIIDSGISPKVGSELNIAAAYDLSGQMNRLIRQVRGLGSQVLLELKITITK